MSTEECIILYPKPAYISQDLKKCIVDGDQYNKIPKRIKRMELIERVLCDSESTPKIPYEYLKYAPSSNGQKEDVVAKFLATEGAQLQKQSLNKFKICGGDYEKKKEVDDVVTKTINANNRLHYDSLALVKKIFKKMMENSEIYKHVRLGNINFVLKGSANFNLSLRSNIGSNDELHPGLKNELLEQTDKMFTDGDNDTGIIINPHLTVDIFNYLKDLIKHEILKNMGQFIEYIKQSLDLPEEFTNDFGHKFKLGKSSSYHIEPQEDSMLLLNYDTPKNPVYFTDNCIKISSDNGFDLLRFKAAYFLDGLKFGGELIDIAIPHQDKTNAESFEKINERHYNAIRNIPEE